MDKEYLSSQLVDAGKFDENTGASMSSKARKEMLLEKMSRESKSKPAYHKLLEQGDIFRQHLEFSSEKENIRIEEIDRHFLKGFLSYVNRLYSTGEISESAYISLVTQAAESYAERLINLKLSKALEECELYLEKASLRWFS